MDLSVSTSNGSFISQTNPVTTVTSSVGETDAITLTTAARYVRMAKNNSLITEDFELDALAYNYTLFTCSDVDKDGDGIVDRLDLDSDNDGIADISEVGGTDANGDGKIDGLNPDGTLTNDADGDGYDDDLEATPFVIKDSDGDGIADFRDLDADNDGLADLRENGGTDANGDGKTDNFAANDANGDGWHDSFDGADVLVLSDTDGDNVANYLDIDSDNDGITDVIEYGQPDADGNGRTDNTADLNQDGLRDAYAAGNAIVVRNTDSDGDAIPDYLDLDSDNDGVPDVQEAGGTGISNANGQIDAVYVDLNGNGRADTLDNLALTAPDTDRDGVRDFRDLDSDNDGIVDVIEAGGTANPATGRIASFNDAGTPNGWQDALEGFSNNLPRPDSDSDGKVNLLDLDSDNDGIVDNREGQTTAGYIAPTIGDSDGDGLRNIYDPSTGGTLLNPALADIDGTLPDYVDTDSDGDGVADRVEGHDADMDGFADWDTDKDYAINDEAGGNTDTDGDGILDIFDTETSITAISNVTGSNAARQNTDAADEPDWRDTDDDNDGIATITENPDGVVDGSDYTEGGFPMPDYLFNGDSDNDLVSDLIDKDDDNDGIPDEDEQSCSTGTISGNAQLVETNSGSLNNPSNMLGAADGDITEFLANTATITLELTDTVPSGQPVTVTWRKGGTAGGSVTLQVATSATASGFVATTPSSSVNSVTTFQNTNYTTNTKTKFVRLTRSAGAAAKILIADAVSYSYTGTVCVDIDSDGDGIVDRLDLDSDNDGIADIREAGFADLNGDGRIGAFTDADGDGLADSLGAFVATNSDFDVTGDNLPDYRDRDSDNDGIADLTEAGGVDADKNGIVDDLTDNNGDGFADIIDNGDTLTLFNSDSDALADYRDRDSDNDGISDFREAGATADAGADGVVDNPTDINQDGIADRYIAGGAAPLPLFNSDGDAFLDYRDRDSDNDGISDFREAGGTAAADANGDGEVDATADANSDGFRNAVSGANALPIPNSDGTGAGADNLPNYRDRDSDQDGIADLIEAGAATDIGGDGIVDDLTDADDDGFADVYEGAGVLPLTNSDGDLIPNYLDRDSDNDGIPDLREAGGVDANGDGKVDSFSDANGDGLHNPYTGVGVLPRPNNDGDGLANWLDLDSDNDGIADVIEAGGFNRDANNDGVVDNTTDANNDGFYDGVALTNKLPIRDQDGDGLANYLDLDTDGDGMADIVEAGGTDTDGDGQVDDFGIGATNGFANSVRGGTGTPLPRPDADGDGFQDFRDRDSDGDGIADAYEMNAIDDDNDGNADGIDGNGDGWADAYTGVDTLSRFVDTDGDGVPDKYDLDSDNDGIPDAIESSDSTATVIDADYNGRANGTDLTADGWIDSREGQPIVNRDTTFAIGTDPVPDFRDFNTDGDAELDWTEGFDDDEDGFALNDLIARADDYETAAGSPGHYVSGTDAIGDNGSTGADGIPDFMNDSDNDGVPDFLDADNALFLDDDGDGLINLFDTDDNGQAYGEVSGEPDNDGDDIPNYRDPSEAIPLPLDLVSFTGKRRGEVSVLNWQTADEKDVSHFEVQRRSSTADAFAGVGRVAARNISGLQNYSLVDEQPATGVNYYRLKMVDLDGTTSYSHEVAVTFDKMAGGLELSLYPNPAENFVYVQTNGGDAAMSSYSMVVYDAAGRMMNLPATVSLSDELTRLDVSGLSAGVYVIRISGSDTVETLRFVKKK